MAKKINLQIDLDAIKESVGNLVDAGVAQTKRVTTAAKLKSDNMAQKDTIRKAYTAIGKAYYAKMKDQPEEDFEELFAKVDAAFKAIAANEALLAVMRAEKDAVVDVDDVEIEDIEDVMDDEIFDEEKTSDDMASEEENSAQDTPDSCDETVNQDVSPED